MALPPLTLRSHQRFFQGVGGSTFLHLAVHSNLAVPITPTSARLVSSEAALCCRIVHLAAGGATGGSARVSTDEEGGDGNLDTQADLCLAAGGTLRLKVPFRPGTEGLIVVQQLEIMMGSEPCTISLQLPVTSDSSATEPPQLRVGAPKPTLMIQLERPQPLLVLPVPMLASWICASSVLLLQRRRLQRCSANAHVPA